MKKKLRLSVLPAVFLILISGNSYCQTLELNDLGYFETRGVNVLVYRNV